MRKIFGFRQEDKRKGEEEYMRNHSTRIKNEDNCKNAPEFFQNHGRFQGRKVHQQDFSRRAHHGRPGRIGMRHLTRCRFTNRPNSKASARPHKGYAGSSHYKIHGSHDSDRRGYRIQRDIIREIERLEKHSRRIHHRLHTLRRELATLM